MPWVDVIRVRGKYLGFNLIRIKTKTHVALIHGDSDSAVDADSWVVCYCFKRLNKSCIIAQQHKLASNNLDKNNCSL